MKAIRRKESLVLFLGDLGVFFASICLAVLLRYRSETNWQTIIDHLAPFSILFLASVFINFIAGLYEKHTVLFKDKLPSILIKVQIINAIISIVFFYFIPYFLITPKVTLFIYLIISLMLMILWRVVIVGQLKTPRKYKALLIAEGEDAKTLSDEINGNSRYSMSFSRFIDTSGLNSLRSEEIIDIIRSEKISIVVADFSSNKVDEIMPALCKLIYTGIQFADLEKMYEEIFDKVPLSLVKDTWFLENISTTQKSSFDMFKRFMDVVVSLVLGTISLAIYPFVYIAVKLEDHGTLFSYQNRVGQSGKIARIMKFRTMSIANDNASWGNTQNKVTKVGEFLRKSRIDELPQLWNVFIGDVSLIGPRPEFPDPVAVYSSQIPYYNMRHIVKPGLSGWAQIYGRHPHHGIDASDTRDKLSYDLYYIKNRSLLLDLKIALKTIKVLLSFVGR